MPDASISLLPVGGIWEFLGTDRNAGVWAENVIPIDNGWGPLSATFDLHRNPRQQWPDIGALTRVDIEITGQKRWSGRIKGTPTHDDTDTVINVQCEGWQAHLDDDAEVAVDYVHTSLTDFKDYRSYLTADLTRLRANQSPTVGDGGIILGWSQGETVSGISSNDLSAVVLDLGQMSRGAKRVVINWQAINANAAMTCILRGMNQVAFDFGPSSGFQDIISTAHNALTATQSGTFTTPYRYLAIFIARTDGVSSVLTNDVLLKITGIQVFANTAYESGNASILRADDVIRDALNRATILLSSDRSLIDPTNVVAFNIPTLFDTALRTPREVWSGVNAYHNFEAKIDADRRPIFRPLPSAPQIEVGEWSEIEPEDSSQGSSDDIYNQVIVEYSDPSGNPCKVLRTAGQQAGAALTAISTPAVDNPSFATDALHWAGTGGAVSRTTTAGQFDSGSAGGLWTSAGFGGRADGTITGTFKKGLTYVLTCRIKAVTGAVGMVLNFGNLNFGGDAAYLIQTALSTGFTSFAIAWTPAVDTNVATIQLNSTFGSWSFYFDTFNLFVATPTLIDRAGFKKTKLLQVDSPLPTDGIAAAQLGDTYLAGHKTTPFKGRIQIAGGVREILTGREVPLEELGSRTNQLIRLVDRVNPDDGAAGRDGRMVQVSYDVNADVATVDLDSTSQNFEANIARLSVISGSHS